MQAKAKRILKPGLAYNKLIPKAKGCTILVNPSSTTVEETVAEIKVIVAETLNQTKALSTKLLGSDLNSTCKNIWQWIYDHIQYELDSKFQEQLREPARLWKDKKGDCDCYSITASSILTNLGIPHLLRITKYNFKPNFQHIYVIVPKNGDLKQDYDYSKNKDKYLVIDAVTDHYNYEVFYTEKRDYPMQLARLNGLGNTSNDVVIVASKKISDSISIGFDAKGNAYSFTDAQVSGIGNLDDLEGFEGLGVLDEFDGVEGYEEFQGLGLFKKLRQRVSNDFKRATQQVTKVVNRAGDSAAGKIFKTVTAPMRLPAMAAQNLLKGKGIKESIVEAGKQQKADSKEGIHMIQKYLNPAAQLLRNGILACLKLNMFNVTGRLRFAYLSDEEATKRGYNLDTIRHARRTRDQLLNIFTKSGGEERNFKNAVLNSKINKSSGDKVLGGFEGAGEYDGFDDFMHGFESIEGLGAAPVAAGAAVASATGVIAKIANVLSKGGKLFSAAKQAAETAKGFMPKKDPMTENKGESDSTTLSSEQESAARKTIETGIVDAESAKAIANGVTPAAESSKDSKDKNTKLIVFGVLGTAILLGGTYLATRQKTSLSREAYAPAPVLAGVSRKKKIKKHSKKRLHVTKF